MKLWSTNTNNEKKKSICFGEKITEQKIIFTETKKKSRNLWKQGSASKKHVT